jgi:hypothetical protein
MSRIGVFGLTPGSVVKSKYSPESSPCNLIVRLVWISELGD